jgi:N-acetylglucosamine-6-phosphate deacetylase
MTTARTVIHSARLVSGGATTPDAWVAFDSDSVLAVGTGTGWQSLGVDADRVTDAAGRWLTPGFIDIHCHGGGGAAFDDGVEGIRTALDLHHHHGTTRIVLSLITASQADLEARLAIVADATEQNGLILGAHLEGPFLDETFRGAHDPALLRAPDTDSIARLLAAGRGHLRQVTLAPEQPGAGEAIRSLIDAGVAVAIGHSAADYETALAAFDAGATILTHAFNGMRGIHHRAPGPVAAATHSPSVTLEIINDGVHVHPEVVRLAGAGASDGHYQLGSLAVTVTDGIARLTGGGSIAGSTLTLDGALRRAVMEVGVTVEEAITALTETPARAIGRGHDLGRLAVGYAADAVLLGEGFEVEAVFAAGQRLR